MNEQRPPPSHPAQGPVGWLLSLAGRIIGLLIGALVLRVMLELVGLYFWWPQEGSRHVFQVMKKEQAELVIALQPHPLGDDIVMLLQKGATHVLMANRLLQKPFTGLVYTLVPIRNTKEVPALAARRRPSFSPLSSLPGRKVSLNRLSKSQLRTSATLWLSAMRLTIR